MFSLKKTSCSSKRKRSYRNKKGGVKPLLLRDSKFTLGPLQEIEILELQEKKKEYKNLISNMSQRTRTINFEEEWNELIKQQELEKANFLKTNPNPTATDKDKWNHYILQGKNIIMYKYVNQEEKEKWDELNSFHLEMGKLQN